MTITEPSFVVAIGASAGGLAALENFFEHLDNETNAAFVVIQHLHPDKRSLLDHLLSRHTKMQVRRVVKPTRVEPNCIYVLPEGQMMTIKNSTLVIRKREEDEIINKAVDIFFKSLATAWKERSMGIILSGTGSDGLEGAKAIEDEGGSVLVQEPSTTAFKGMPSQIVSKDHPSLILPPAELAESLSWHLKSRAPYL